MALQGTGLGFLTDKDVAKNGEKPGYPITDVKLVAIEAALMGAHWVGNEFNIISCRPYLTKNFFTRKLREFDGFTDLKLFPGVPVLAGEKGALVPYVATWKLNGVEDRIERLVTKLADNREIDERICVKVNSGMGADAILGKAERKIKAAIYGRLTGSEVADGDVDDVLPKKPAVANLDQLADRLSGNSHDRPQTTTEPDPDLLTDARTGFAACETLGEVAKLAAELITKATDDVTRNVIEGFERDAEVRIGSKRTKKQGELVK